MKTEALSNTGGHVAGRSATGNGQFLSPIRRKGRMTAKAIGVSLILLMALPCYGETPVQPVSKERTPARSIPAPKAGARRDPFKLPAHVAPSRGSSRVQVNTVPAGRRGLQIGDLQLNGVIREESSHGMIALVTGKSKLVYFLRDNDTLYDGRVVSITPDSIEFKQNYLDPDGEVRSRQVIRRLTPAGGEGQ